MHIGQPLWDDSLSFIEDQIEKNNKAKQRLQATYEKVKGKRRPFMQFDIAKIKTMLEKNSTWDSIADAFAVSPNCMRQFAKRNGFYIAISNGARKKIHLDMHQLKALIDQSLSWDEIGQALGVKSKIAQARAREFGFTKKTKLESIDKEQIIVLREQGLSWKEMGQALGVSGNAIRYRARELGIYQQNRRRRRMKIDMDRLKTFTEQGLSWEQIGQALGVKWGTARKHAIDQGINKRNTLEKVEEEQLKDLIDQKISWKKIGEILGITGQAACQRAKRLGIFKHDMRRKA